MSDELKQTNLFNTEHPHSQNHHLCHINTPNTSIRLAKGQESAEGGCLSSNQPANTLEESVNSPEKEQKRIADHKLRYKKLKQKLSTLSEHILDQGVLKDPKDTTSPNKSRLLKLALELERTVKTQAVDYKALDNILKDLQKIVQHRRQHDLLIMRGARVMNTLLYFVKRLPSLHRTEAMQSMQTVQQSLRMLRMMLALGSSREQMLACNQMVGLSSLLTCALMRDEKKLSVCCLSLMNLVLASPYRIELQPLLEANLEYILSSSLVRRLKGCIEGCLSEDDPANSQLLLLSFRFLYLVTRLACSSELHRPIYYPSMQCSPLARAIGLHSQAILQLLGGSLIDLLLQRQQGEEQYYAIDEQIPTFKLNMVLLIYKTYNILLHFDCITSQQGIEFSPAWVKATTLVFEYSKANFKQNNQTRSLCSQIISFIGRLGIENIQKQNQIRQAGLLSALCNHPIEYLMESNLKHVLMPAYCVLIHHNKHNFAVVFEENSPQPLLQYLIKESKILRDRRGEEEPVIVETVSTKSMKPPLSRKASASSINSSYSKGSIAESLSTQASNHLALPLHFRESPLQHQFRPQHWQPLMAALRALDD